MNWEETLAGCNIFQVGASLKANREGRRVQNRCGKSKHLENETLAQTDNFFFLSIQDRRGSKLNMKLKPKLKQHPHSFLLSY